MIRKRWFVGLVFGVAVCLAAPSTTAHGDGTITSYAASAKNNTTTPKTVSRTWVEGEVVVVGAITETAGSTVNTPTATGLTFNHAASITGGTDEVNAYVWVSDPAAAGATANVSVTVTGTTLAWGFDAWVVAGVDDVGDTFADRNEATGNLDVAAGSVVVYVAGDWTANATNQTMATGSGTATERSDGTQAGIWAWGSGDWVGTAAGTFAFGLGSYAGLQIAQVAVELLATTPPTTTTTTTTTVPEETTTTTEAEETTTTVAEETTTSVYTFADRELHRISQTLGVLVTIAIAAVIVGVWSIARRGT